MRRQCAHSLQPVEPFLGMGLDYSIAVLLLKAVKLGQGDGVFFSDVKSLFPLHFQSGLFLLRFVPHFTNQDRLSIYYFTMRLSVGVFRILLRSELIHLYTTLSICLLVGFSTAFLNNTC